MKIFAEPMKITHYDVHVTITKEDFLEFLRKKMEKHNSEWVLPENLDEVAVDMQEDEDKAGESIIHVEWEVIADQ